MPRQRRNCPALPSSQHGAVLAAVLMIIVIVTIIGVTAIDTASLEGKLTHNFRERGQAFQAAEAALRAGERVLDNLIAEPERCDTPPCSCDDEFSCRVWRREALQRQASQPPGDTDRWWSIQDIHWWQNMGATAVPSGTAINAFYLVEERAFVQNNTQANVIGSGQSYFTVTAVGIHPEKGAQVVLQSHFMRRFN